jgi:hypothetical protein
VTPTGKRAREMLRGQLGDAVEVATSALDPRWRHLLDDDSIARLEQIRVEAQRLLEGVERDLAGQS